MCHWGTKGHFNSNSKLICSIYLFGAFSTSLTAQAFQPLDLNFALFPVSNTPSSSWSQHIASWANFLFFSFSFFLLLFFFRAAPVAYGHSQSRCWIGAAADSPCHSHSNVGSEPRLPSTPQLMVMLDPRPTEWGQGWNPHPHGYWLDPFLFRHNGNLRANFLMQSSEPLLKTPAPGG